MLLRKSEQVRPAVSAVAASYVPKRSQKVQNSPFIFLLVDLVAAMACLGYVAISRGDPGKLVHGLDSWGNVCGRKDNRHVPGVPFSGMDHSDRTFRYRLQFSTTVQNNGSQTGQNVTRTINSTLSFCFSECPNVDEYFSDVLQQEGYDQSLMRSVERHLFRRHIMSPQTAAMLNRCIQPAGSESKGSDPDVKVRVNGEPSVIERTMEVVALHGRICSLHMVAVVVVLILTWLMLVAPHFGAGVIAITLFLGFTGLTMIFYINIDITDNALQQRHMFGFPFNLAVAGKKKLMMLAFWSTFLTIWGWCVLAAWKKRFVWMLRFVKFCNRRMISCMSMLLCSALYYFVVAIMFTYVITVVVSMVTVMKAKVTDDGTVGFVSRSDFPNGIMLFLHLAGALWIWDFLYSCKLTVMSGTVVRCFFRRRRHRLSGQCDRIFRLRCVLSSAHHLIRYDLGTVIAGSLLYWLSTVPRMFAHIARLVLEVCIHIVESATSKQTSERWINSINQFLAYTDRDALICVAMYGDGFFINSKRAALLNSKPLTHGNTRRQVGIISELMVVMGQLDVGLIVAVIAAGGFPVRTVDGMILTEESILMASLSFLGAFGIARCFMDTFAIVVKATYLCSSEDRHHNNGFNQPYFTNDYLWRLLGQPEPPNQVGKCKGGNGKQDDTNPGDGKERVTVGSEVTGNLTARSDNSDWLSLSPRDECVDEEESATVCVSTAVCPSDEPAVIANTKTTVSKIAADKNKSPQNNEDDEQCNTSDNMYQPESESIMSGILTETIETNAIRESKSDADTSSDQSVSLVSQEVIEEEKTLEIPPAPSKWSGGDKTDYKQEDQTQLPTKVLTPSYTLRESLNVTKYQKPSDAPCAVAHEAVPCLDGDCSARDTTKTEDVGAAMEAATMAVTQQSNTVVEQCTETVIVDERLLHKPRRLPPIPLKKS